MSQDQTAQEVLLVFSISMAFADLSTQNQVFPINMEEIDLENNSVRLTEQ